MCRFVKVGKEGKNKRLGAKMNWGRFVKVGSKETGVVSGWGDCTF